jgi:hypothetical protein
MPSCERCLRIEGRVTSLLSQFGPTLTLSQMKSELNFPVGERTNLDFGIDADGLRWDVPMHLWEGIFGAPTQTVPKWLSKDEYAEDVLQQLNHGMQMGFERGSLQRRPHVSLLDPQFYRDELMPVLVDWMLLLLKREHIGTEEGVGLRQIKDFLLDHVLGAAQQRELDRLSPQGWKLLNLAYDWCHVFMPHCLAKVNR